jgi:nucleoside-diphosphate-sugar epimerase
MSVKALVDGGATRDFIDSEYVISGNLLVRRLSQPIPVLNVNGSPNQAHSIAGIVNMVVDYKGLSECIQLTMTRLRKQHIILSYSWLQKHNPEIKWETKEVCMTCCPTGCCTCCDELQAVQRNEKLVA